MTENMPEDPWAEDAAILNGADLDPFADPDEVGGRSGPFIPSPPADVLADRPVVMVPKSYDGLSPVSEYAQKKYGMGETQEAWRVDLVVLGGEVPFSYAYRGKVEGTTDEFEERTFTVEALPFLIPNFKVTWRNVIGTLNKGYEKGAMVGRLRAGYTAQEMRKGKTFEDWQAEYSAWEEKARKNPRTAGEAPRARWHFELSPKTGADKDLASAWFKGAYAGGYRIDPTAVVRKNVPERNS